jgi:hypothetical protein
MSTVLDRTRLAGQLLRTQGPGWLAFRVRYALERRAGLLRRRLPATSWDAQPLRSFLRDADLARPEAYLAYRRGGAPAFFTPADGPAARALLAGWDEGRDGPVERVEELRRGVLRYFEHTPAAVGSPPDWHVSPFTGGRVPADRHWSRIGDFGHGDIKVLWEPGRFGFVYTLVRAARRTGDGRCAELFWEWVESWCAHNPPQLGPHWKCGQEASLRVMAWCFGLYGFLDAPATTPGRVAALAQMIAVTGRRIEATLGYALSQRNNHAISEGTGLWTIGLLFPELRAAPRWRALGRRVLEAMGRELIYDDGAFAQHSVNYHRLMLHDYLWSFRLGDRLGHPLSDGLRERVGRAGDFLYQIQDAETGHVPHYGQNDGALILPLNNCDYWDFRPVIQATRYLATGSRPFGDGPWDEDLFWLFGPDAVGAPVSSPPRTDLRAEVGGYYTLRAASGFAFLRCATFRHRPGQADMLHLDLWWRGQNVALDAGTYSYNAPAPWDKALAHTAPHNTVTVDGLSQMDAPGPFLWLPWLRARVHARVASAGGLLAYWEGGHDGYARLPRPAVHRRAVVRLGEEHWLVLDDLRSRGPHRYRLHWLMPDWPHAGDPRDDGNGSVLTLQTPCGPYAVRLGVLHGQGRCSSVRAEPDGTRGWWSPYYLHREPALSLDLTQDAPSTRFWTLLGPPGCVSTATGSGLRVEHPSWRADLELGAAADEPIVTRIVLSGSVNDRLEVCR